MQTWDEKALKYNYGEKSLKAPFVIYLDLEWLLLKMLSCQNNPKNSYTERKLYMNLLTGHYLGIVHLMQQKANLIITEE